MMVTVGNIKNYKGGDMIRVDRSSCLGNPFKIGKDGNREQVIAKYEEYFAERVQDKNSAFVKELRRIYQLAKSRDILLGCWCYPEHCHADVIKDFIDGHL